MLQHRPFCIVLVALTLYASSAAPPVAAADLRVLFLGDSGHHQPRVRFALLESALRPRGFELTYTDRLTDLNAATLSQYDALLLYANIERIEPEQEQALLAYVDGGGGFAPIHCATYCFLNSPRLIDLMGAQFQRHGAGVFRVENVAGEHPLLRGYGGFESWDETYVHHRHNGRDRTVLEERVDDQGREPWTWIRTHGQGRVFYTAWGHDHRTWSHPGFHNLVERGLRWAAGRDVSVVPAYADDPPFPVPSMTPRRTDAAAFAFRDVGGKIPHYLPGQKWGVQGEPHSNMQLPLAPEESLKHLVVPVGFRPELFAAEPDLAGKPIAMNWDERGRLWVAESVDYPNELRPTGQGRDRVRICWDGDGDGRADQFRVFAEGLSIPTALCVCRGGLVVQDGTETVFLQDTDGDGRADRRTTLIANWNVKDTHGGVSNFRYGPDNWIWAMQGYNASQPTIDGQPSQSFRMGFFRFRLSGADPPRVEALEFIRSTDNNTWGLGISEEGLIFGSTANHNPSVFMPIANRYYERVRGWTPALTLGTIADTHLFHAVTDRVRQVDQFGGYTAGAGHALYTARRYPREYWNRTAFVAEPTGHLVGTFVISPEGSHFRSTNAFNLAASDDEWTAPIAAEVGPDGNVWIIDWYNYIVQHNPTPQGFQTGAGAAYETDLRDKRHGRIYRLVYDGSRPAAAMTLHQAAPAELAAALASDNMFWRLQAQRLLVERQERGVRDALVELAADTTVDQAGLNVGAMHALWTLDGLGLLASGDDRSLAAVRDALRHPSAGVRRAAALVLPQRSESTAWLLEANLLADPHPQVRLATLLALAEAPPSAAAGEPLAAAITAAQNAYDRWLPEAGICAAAQHAAAFLQAVAGRETAADALLAPATIVAEHFARGAPGNQVAGVLESLAAADSGIAGAVLRGLSAGWPDNGESTALPQGSDVLGRLFTRIAPADRGLLVKLARRMGDRSLADATRQIQDDLARQLDDGTLTAETRAAAAAQLVDIDPADAAAVEIILSRVTPQTEPAAAEGLLKALERSEAAKLGPLLTAALPRLTPAARPVAIAVLLGRSQSTRALLRALADGTIQLQELSLAQRRALAEHPDPTLRLSARGLLERGGALPNPDRQRVLEEFLPIAQQTGDAAAGKLAFKKHCAKCHRHSGEGERIGPELTGMAVHPKAELLTHILDPNRSVEGNFQTYTVALRDGRVVVGMLTAESKTAVELLDAENKRTTVLREEIEELARSAKSLMPEGVEKQATREELTDLLEFLTQRGRYLPVDLSKAATISTAAGMFTAADNPVERLLLDDWSSRTVEGVPFLLVDPQGGRARNAILLHGPIGAVSNQMPSAAEVPCGGPAAAIHLLSGVSGWGFPAINEKSVSLIVRLHYADGQAEDHQLVNGEHFADYIRRVDVPQSQFALAMRDQQMRYLSVRPRRAVAIDRIEFIKGPDRSAPVVLAVTLESPAGP